MFYLLKSSLIERPFLLRQIFLLCHDYNCEFKYIFDNPLPPPIAVLYLVNVAIEVIHGIVK